MSITKAEFFRKSEDAKEALRLAGFVRELHVEQSGFLLHCDRKNVIYLTKN